MKKGAPIIQNGVCMALQNWTSVRPPKCQGAFPLDKAMRLIRRDRGIFSLTPDGPDRDPRRRKVKAARKARLLMLRSA